MGYDLFLRKSADPKYTLDNTKITLRNSTNFWYWTAKIWVRNGAHTD